MIIDIDFNGPVRGIEFELEYDSEMIELHSPRLLSLQENVLISSKMNNDYRKKIVVANLQGGEINPRGDSYVMIPLDFKGLQYDIGMVEIRDVMIIGINGSILDNIVQSSASEVKLIPGQYSLKQNSS